MSERYGLHVCARTARRDCNALYDLGFTTKLKPAAPNLPIKIAYAGKAWPLRFASHFDFDIDVLRDDGRIVLTAKVWDMEDPTPEEIEATKAEIRATHVAMLD